MAEFEPSATVRLTFDSQASTPGVKGPQHNASCVIHADDTLFLACDEGATLERLLRHGQGFAGHRRIRLGELIDLPGGSDSEMDIEGLSIEGDWLWVVGSQSLKRKKLHARGQADVPLAKLARVDWQPNRQFLGRFPLVRHEGGLWPVAQDGERRAMHLKFRGRGQLRRWLAKDPHLAPFLEIPSKENGLDVEGIATRGDRVWLGLRGPVLGRRAVILELELRPTRKGHLKASRIDGQARLRKHLVDTNGEGIRDMKWDGDDLLLITGPVLSGRGPTSIRRLPGFARQLERGVVGPEEVTLACDLPDRGEVDHPEGLTRWDGTDWLVVHDSPDPKRVSNEPPSLDAEVWTLR
ncbi:DUF3616 domain-containing protein [Rubellimicrobium rubrum]|uniref:DUF3616 domain-containing protein n=1 Tax=Rubellimicrobium rubrum TaxID=2585369 RepID=A0A5C4N2X4_9RHOB|nr:DUF3616 domain-containing protein [Rubellimicrobium rubrum]TNC53034.1 DUF3616 domain-containing protein [Rubellimicrobium rubrum]